MIKLECDNCEKSFEVDPEETGDRAPCPFCGDINRVPASETPAAPAATGGDGTEHELCVVRPAMFRAHPFRYLLLVALVIGGLVVTFWSLPETGLPDWLRWPGLVAAALGLLWWVYWWVSSTRWIRVTISNKRTIRYEGIIRRHSTEVLHDHVRSVDIQQNFLQRLLKVGYIGIDSAGQDGIEIEIRDIPGPYQIKKLIDQYRQL